MIKKIRKKEKQKLGIKLKNSANYKILKGKQYQEGLICEKKRNSRRDHRYTNKLLENLFVNIID
jgi:hypothetical protein